MPQIPPQALLELPVFLTFEGTRPLRDRDGRLYSMVDATEAFCYAVRREIEAVVSPNNHFRYFRLLSPSLAKQMARDAEQAEDSNGTEEGSSSVTARINMGVFREPLYGVVVEGLPGDNGSRTVQTETTQVIGYCYTHCALRERRKPATVSGM